MARAPVQVQARRRRGLVLCGDAGVGRAVSTPADNVHLRLRDAARLAFPMGGVTERSLRREAARGRLRLYRIAGRDFTTLADNADMTRACVLPKVGGVAAIPPGMNVSRSLAAARDALAKLA